MSFRDEIKKLLPAASDVKVMYISQFIEYFLGDIISAAYSVPPKVYDEDEETDDEFYRDDPDYR